MVVWCMSLSASVCFYNDELPYRIGRRVLHRKCRKSDSQHRTRFTRGGIFAIAYITKVSTSNRHFMREAITTSHTNKDFRRAQESRIAARFV